MSKIVLFIFLFIAQLSANAQHDFIILRKGSKTLARYERGSFITLQLQNREWYHGEIVRIANDSLYVHRMTVSYSMMGMDTSHYGIIALALRDVYALPKKRAMFNYEGQQVKLIRGKQVFVYLKNGLILQLAGGGFLALNLINSVIRDEPPFGKKNIGNIAIGTGIFLIGEMLRRSYKPTLKMGRRTYLKYVSLSGSNQVFLR